ncbi:MAG: hypothetical protein KAX49_13575 [Halanaerobiales bacterium]|nr:hypothetical protein [Halanaerobiales bacterium]
MRKSSEYEFANLNEIELKKIKEVEESINQKMRVNSGNEVFLMAYTSKEIVPNESGEIHDDVQPTYSL